MNWGVIIGLKPEPHLAIDFRRHEEVSAQVAVIALSYRRLNLGR
jgi:hypothetical protein